MDFTEAFYQAKRALETTNSCDFWAQAYGFPKCRTHSGGVRTGGSSQLMCDKVGAEGRLRQALADLVPFLRVSIEIKQ